MRDSSRSRDATAAAPRGEGRGDERQRSPRGEHPEDEPAPHRHTAEMPVIEPGDDEEEATEPEPQPQRVAKDDRPASLVIQTSFLGDMVLTTRLIAELARRGPVDDVATPASAVRSHARPGSMVLGWQTRRRRGRHSPERPGFPMRKGDR